MTSPTDKLEHLISESGLWRASNINYEFRQGIPSGYPLLDSHLTRSGWPTDGVTEFLYDHYGIGELRLLAPALAYLSQRQSRKILMISPPFIPYPPALNACGINLRELFIVQPKTIQDTLWVLEQALSSRSCSAVIAWPQKISDKQVRRLQVISKEGNTWNILFRRTNVEASPAELRIRLYTVNSHSHPYSSVHVKIVKQRGGWESNIFRINFVDNLNQKTPDFSKLLVNYSDHNDTNILQWPMDLPPFPTVTD
ncbi:MAG: SOS cell division inhibitor SulA [Gammaproteobacteria bacterium]|uniref:Translesion DNA synthesis-associated protein ImuA n=1 Tax=OM182 bacterium TaxID=2510334 RepID=A0A520RZB7_9GAMM|nr:SOS cell division inhibitor SulA [Gammaproteobacteria bacterium]OUV67856.1 MAG: hypothetical protein CBC93_03820 [Gammaproteobacteria bacterium TMED133]RZO75551.1 MAG: translesion DNA synthesis-associated protein ImuA [OM182 bacterium]